MKKDNTMHLLIPARSENESFARVVVGAFVARLNPTIEEIADIKTAVSEAVTNAIVHAYAGGQGVISIDAAIEGDAVEITVGDDGCGIDDVAKAMEPFYTTRADEERSGMGFAVMQSFMDDIQVRSAPGEGTCVRMLKRIAQ